MTIDEKYMKRALDLAKKGEGRTSPNPMVGCVIVKDDRIIGEGYHEKYGELHAERNAFKNCSESAEGATLYVTLEPCCHHGKTSPCTDAIIENKIKRVVIGTLDTNPLVGGKGMELLKQAGIEVTLGILEDECKSINEIFFHYTSTKRPFVALKYAMTLDGKIACYTGDSMWITNKKSRELVHKLRNKYSAIMVGVNTVIYDDPMLNCRIEGGADPVRIVCDSNLRIPLESKIVKTAKDIRTIVACTVKESSKIELLMNNGVEILVTSGKTVNLDEVLQYLANNNIDSVFVEGGGVLHSSFIRQRLVDRVYSFIAPKIVGGERPLSPVAGKGIKKMSDAIQLDKYEIINIDEDILITGKVKKDK